MLRIDVLPAQRGDGLWISYDHGADTRHLLARLDLPTLVLHSRGDQATDFKKGRYLAATIPGARFEIIADAGHIPGVERPAEVARLIGDFLKETGHV